MEVRFGMNRLDLCMGKDRPFTEEERKELDSIISRLLKDEPVQYILKQTEFCGKQLVTIPGALIPRPETEELVRWIVDQAPRTPIHILDIGTGSGCIAVSLATALPHSNVTGIDISKEALDIARENARLAEVDIALSICDILNTDCWNEPPLASPTAQWDIIVSNPPYICQSEALEMHANVLNYEPATALFVPDNDPLLFYRSIARYAQSHLKKDGQLFFEINRRYGAETIRLLQTYAFHTTELRKDFRNNDRMIRCTR
ncbi:MAG: peptide chain release factor N(5)-glutamine methyltransferase [Clostridium sp.]|nr:peptide chain release factor N(5)-glutamine methyltransferase [Clostridium sp.]